MSTAKSPTTPSRPSPNATSFVPTAGGSRSLAIRRITPRATCWRRSLPRPRAMGLGPDALDRILVVRLGSLGDLVHTLPAVSALRRKFPEARIDWVVDR